MNGYFKKPALIVLLVLLAIFFVYVFSRYAVLAFTPVSKIQVPYEQAERGSIVDRRGKPLAVQTNFYHVGVTPHLVKNKEQFAHDVSVPLDMDEKIILRILENNPKAKSFIQTRLGEGIYLLNIPLDDDFSKFSESVGLEFMGNVKNPEIGKETLPFPLLQSARKLDFENTAEQNAELLEELLQEGNKTKAQYFKTLKSLGLTKQQENALALRIEKGIIISQEQLRAENVRLEILETDGMNYAGKIRMIENAILSGALLELSMPNDNEASKMNTFLGKPISLSKRQDDCILKFRLEQSGEIRLFSVGMANKIKLVKTSIFD